MEPVETTGKTSEEISTSQTLTLSLLICYQLPGTDATFMFPLRLCVVMDPSNGFKVDLFTFSNTELLYLFKQIYTE